MRVVRINGGLSKRPSMGPCFPPRQNSGQIPYTAPGCRGSPASRAGSRTRRSGSDASPAAVRGYRRAYLLAVAFLRWRHDACYIAASRRGSDMVGCVAPIGWIAHGRSGARAQWVVRVALQIALTLVVGVTLVSAAGGVCCTLQCNDNSTFCELVDVANCSAAC